MKSLSFLAIALIVLACLAWSPADARLFDTLVSKTNPSSESSLSLIATEAINAELAKMKKTMPSDVEVAQLEDMVRAMIPTDGGTARINKSYKDAKAAVNNATNTMLDKLVSDYDQAKKDLKALDDAIDASTQTISAADLEGIKMKAQDWCFKKQTLETQIGHLKGVESALENYLASQLALPHILVKEVSGLGEEDCSKSQGTLRDGSCPPQSCTLSSRIAAKVDSIRADYLDLTWRKYDIEGGVEKAMMAEGKSMGAFQEHVTTTARNYHSICVRDDKVHDDAVKMFNDNNVVRASMFLSLGTIQCHMNHMKSGETFNIREKLVKKGENGTSNDVENCIGKLKSEANLKSDHFRDATSNEDSGKVCPTMLVYEELIEEYGNFGFHKNETKWSPTKSKCEDVSVVPDMKDPAMKGPGMKGPGM